MFKNGSLNLRSITPGNAPFPCPKPASASLPTRNDETNLDRRNTLIHKALYSSTKDSRRARNINEPTNLLYTFLMPARHTEIRDNISAMSIGVSRLFMRVSLITAAGFLTWFASSAPPPPDYAHDIQPNFAHIARLMQVIFPK